MVEEGRLANQIPYNTVVIGLSLKIMLFTQLESSGCGKRYVGRFYHQYTKCHKKTTYIPAIQ